MFGAILKATNSSFQKGMTFCRSVFVKKVMKLLAFIFEQPGTSLQMQATLLTTNSVLNVTRPLFTRHVFMSWYI